MQNEEEMQITSLSRPFSTKRLFTNLLFNRNLKSNCPHLIYTNTLALNF